MNEQGMHQASASVDGAVLTLALGTTTGWALRTLDDRITSGAICFNPVGFKGGGMRFLRLLHQLDELHAAAGGLAEAHFEEVRRHAGVDAAHAYGGFLATLMPWCEHRGIPYAGTSVSKIKRHPTGKGNANNAAMIAAMRRRSFESGDNNEADALALLRRVLDGFLKQTTTLTARPLAQPWRLLFAPRDAQVWWSVQADGESAPT
jgi:hypothetical protein